jgi:hypothetical protein
VPPIFPGPVPVDVDDITPPDFSPSPFDDGGFDDEDFTMSDDQTADIFSSLIDAGVDAFGDTEIGQKVIARQKAKTLATLLQDPMNLLVVGVVLFFAVRGLSR